MTKKNKETKKDNSIEVEFHNENNGNNQTKEDISSKDYYDGLVDFIIDKWTEKGLVKDIEETKELIHAMIYVFIGKDYELKDVVSTYFDIDNYMSEYDQMMNGD